MSAGILGTSYSGSTLLSFVLGGHSRVFAVSETTTLKRDAGLTECTMCKFQQRACPFWTRGLVWTCLANFNERYRLIEEAALQKLSRDLVLFSDKSPVNYQPAIQYSSINRFIITFKRPEAFLYSFRKHRRLNGINDTLERIMSIYVRHYESDFRFIENNDYGSYFLFYEDFCAKPNSHTQDICESFLDCEFEPAMMDFWKSELHPLTGNMGPYMNVLDEDGLERILQDTAIRFYDESHFSWHRQNRRSIANDDRWKTDLDPESLAFARHHNRAQEVFASLMTKRRIVGPASQ